jgi:hypothetical protein
VAEEQPRVTFDGLKRAGKPPNQSEAAFNSPRPFFEGAEQQAHTTEPMSPKKRKTDIGSAFSVHDDTLLQGIEDVIAKALIYVSPRGPTQSLAVRKLCDLAEQRWKKLRKDNCNSRNS